VSSSATSGAEVTMPQMGVSVAEGTVVEWHKRVGDWVERDEVIVEISTDKVETEIPSPESGRVSEILVPVGTTVDVGTLLARIDVAAKPGEPHVVEEVADGRWQMAETPTVTPVVRRIAAQHGIDLSKVTGSGRNGRVTKKDVMAHVQEPKPDPVLHIESPYREETAGEPLSPMRKSIADHMVRSLQTAAHCTTVVEVDMSAVEAARGKLSYLPFVAGAAIAALREVPQLNATIEGDRITRHQQVNLGIAVSLGDDGLIVPVVKDAHELSHEGLAGRIADLAERARGKRLSPDETKGGTFTITNPGRYGALLATPIINQPQVAILDLEAVVKRPVAVGDAIAIRPMTYLCMSWDHRALDGAVAAQFLSALRGHLERWNS
jgi:pyruvate/2-oxoglutarate dehydrogenase complex dihydrolipoamide acyltransferase (E2) component